MTAHKYRPGQTVTIMPRAHEARPEESFKIVRVLPSERGTNQYRVQSVKDGHERVVMEHELS